MAFFENAIFLEIKRRSQGKCVKMDMSNANALRSPAPKSIYPYPVRDLLDDIALVASGSGGADNVTAACLEIHDQKDRTMVLRLARNAGAGEGLLNQLNSLLEIAATACSNGFVNPSEPR